MSASMFTGDAWEAAANRHLLQHIREQMALNSRRYGRPACYVSLRASRSGNGDASPEFIGNVGRLVEAKKAWAADMRDLAANTADGTVPGDLQRSVWKDHIGRAEADIRKASAA